MPTPDHLPYRWRQWFRKGPGLALALMELGVPWLKLNSPHPPTGRVARAGRSGTAYSLVAPDEVPYLLDLHLFLGRSVTLARPHEEPSGETRLDRAQAAVVVMSRQGAVVWLWGMAAGSDHSPGGRHRRPWDSLGCWGYSWAMVARVGSG